jgi:hypothetical protein
MTTASDSWPPPEGYRGGRLTAWARIIDDPSKPPTHWHACPVCYDGDLCNEACTLEPDLERSDGTPSGGHEECSKCSPRPVAPPPPKPAPIEQLAFAF